MKLMFLIFVIMAITINSSIFLRKLESSTTQVTKDSCEKSGKGFDEGKPAQCKKGDTLYNVTEEAKCNVGTWAEKCSASATPALTKEECQGQGTLKYSSNQETTEAVCKVQGTTDTDKIFPESNGSQKECENKIYKINKCKTSGINIEDCQGPAVFTDAKESCVVSGTKVIQVDSSDTCAGITLEFNTDSKCVIKNGYTCTVS